MRNTFKILINIKTFEKRCNPVERICSMNSIHLQMLLFN